MNIAITGASGFLGSLITDRLRKQGHAVRRLVRSREAARADDAIFWKPAEGDLDLKGLAGHHAVINLAGENIFALWTGQKKERIYRSRVDGTRLLARSLAALPEDQRPHVLVNASAVGYFGTRPPHEPLTEDAPPGDSFMAGVVQDWEAATGPAADAGIRVAMLRFAPILDTDAFIIQATGLTTRLGLGATLGSGRQAFPWVTREDAANIAILAATEPLLSGPVNVVAPEKVTHREFADAAARVLKRPRFLQIPAPVVRLLGDFGREMLTGAWIVPSRLEAAGYQWHDPELEPALRRMYNRT